MHVVRRLARVGLLGLALGGCGVLGRALDEAFRERPAVPLDSMSVASDARVDTAGVLAGSFVGEGTVRTVHLLSSDTSLIATLARRYRPDVAAGDGLWPTLAARRVVALGETGRRRTSGGGLPQIRVALVGSPLGHTEVTVESILLHGSRCRDNRPQAELLVREDGASDDPPLRGPVLGVLLANPGTAPRRRGLVERAAPPEPSDALARELIDRTRRVMDSALTESLPSLRAGTVAGSRLEINTLAELDAADLVAFRAGEDRVRYAVSLRERRLRTDGRDTLVATSVMVWDSAGAWEQTVFHPTLLAARGGRPVALARSARPLYWRRLQAVADVAYPRDNLWMEQVNVRDGTVLWGIVQPQGNVVVAAAEVGCE